jgi:Spy/CpxP family protein refolding chaperone
MKLLIIILILYTSLFSSDYEEHSTKHINKELSHLKLTKKQNRKIKLILKEFRKDLKSYRELKRDIQKRREKIFLKDNLDLNKLNRLNYSVDIEAHKIENKLLSQVHIILNKNQRREFIYYFDDWEVE